MNQRVVHEWRESQTERLRLAHSGTIVSWTELFVAPTGFEGMTPYVVVLVADERGNKSYGQLVDFEREHLTIGQPVRPVMRRRAEVGHEDVVEYTVKYTPIL